MSNLGGYHTLMIFVIHTVTFSHLEDEKRDWVIKLRRQLWGWKVVRICSGRVQLWAVVLEVLKVQFLCALFTSLIKNLVNSVNTHHDLETVLIHMLMIVEISVIVRGQRCCNGHYPLSGVYLCTWHFGSYSCFQDIGCQCKHLNV